MEEMQSTFMSAEINEISAALSALQGEIEQPALNKQNPYFKSRYVDLSGCLKAAQPVLAKNSLSVAQIIVGNDLVTLLSHKSGQWLKSVCPIGTYKSQQDRGSAITYTKRYALCAILGIAADTDDDGNAATDADKRTGSIANGATNVTSSVTFTGAQLSAAMAELESAADDASLVALWRKKQAEAPALCVNGTEFFNAWLSKRNQLKNNQQ